MVVRLRWHGQQLIDDASGKSLAKVEGNLLQVGVAQLNLTQTTSGVKWCLTAAEGANQWVVQLKSLTVSRLVAKTPTGSYELKRESSFSKRRTIINDRGQVVGVTRPRLNTDLEVQMQALDDLPLVDLAVVTYALTIVDTPHRQVRM